MERETLYDKALDPIVALAGHSGLAFCQVNEVLLLV
jgi:hypothetical protein